VYVLYVRTIRTIHTIHTQNQKQALKKQKKIRTFKDHKCDLHVDKGEFPSERVHRMMHWMCTTLRALRCCTQTNTQPAHTNSHLDHIPIRQERSVRKMPAAQQKAKGGYKYKKKNGLKHRGFATLVKGMK